MLDLKTKKDKIELDVDFIGGQEPLTKEEEEKLSDYFKRNKPIKARVRPRQKTTV